MIRRSSGLAVAAVLAAAAGLVLGTIPAPRSVPSIDDRTPSAEVRRRLERDFGAPLARSAVLLLSNLPVAASSDSGRALVRRIVEPFAGVQGVTAVASPASLLDTLLVGADDRSALVVIGLAAGDELATVDTLQAIIARDPLVGPSAIRADWTGEALLRRDVERATAQALHRAELVAIPLTVLAAVAAFGGIAPALAAAGTAVVAVLVALATLRLLGMVMVVSVLAVPVTVVVATGLALDYALWRRLGGFDRRGIAAAAVVATAGFAALLLAPIGEVRAAAVGGVVAVIVAATLVLVVPGDASAAAGVRGRRWVTAASSRPLLVLLLTVPPLGVLAWHGVRTPLQDDPLAAVPETLPSVATLGRLGAVERLAAVLPVQVLITLPNGATAFDPSGWRHIDSLANALAGVPGVGRVQAVTAIGTRDRSVTRDVVPEAILASHVSRDRRQAVLQVLAWPDTTLAGVMRLADRLERAVAGDTTARLGGAAALARDHQRTLTRAVVPLALLTALGSWLALVGLLRAPVAAAKAVLLNLLVAAAAVGAVAAVSPSVSAAGLPATVPLVAFGTAFAISIDYELLLLLAVRRAGGTGHAAIAAGVASAAPLFARGGALLLVLFGSFALSAFAPLALLGQVLVAAIVLDVVVVRTLVAPALLAVLGRWNWWPAGAGAPAGSGLPSGISSSGAPR